MIAVAPVRDSAEIIETRWLLDEYATWLGPEILCMTGWSEERESLPGAYQPPTGELLLARAEDGAVIGCVGMRDLGDGIVEMKRLYVRPAARGSGAGALLIDRIIAEARASGAKSMVLDTIPGKMDTAIARYRSAGFTEIDCYQSDPIPGAVFLGREL